MQYRGTEYYDLLHLAARHGGKELMEIIITEDGKELESDTINEDGYNILNSAVEANNEDTFYIILNWIVERKEEIGTTYRLSFSDY